MTDDKRRTQYIVAMIVGAIIVASIVFFAYYLPKLMPASPRQVVPSGVVPGLGEVGARCGGEMRLPCRPGNDCKITNAAKGEGVCVKVTDNPAPVKPGE